MTDDRQRKQNQKDEHETENNYASLVLVWIDGECVCCRCTMRNAQMVWLLFHTPKEQGQLLKFLSHASVRDCL